MKRPAKNLRPSFTRDIRAVMEIIRNDYPDRRQLGLELPDPERIDTDDHCNYLLDFFDRLRPVKG